MPKFTLLGIRVSLTPDPTLHYPDAILVGVISPWGQKWPLHMHLTLLATPHAWPGGHAKGVLPLAHSSATLLSLAIGL